MDGELRAPAPPLPAWAEALFASRLVQVRDMAGHATPVWAIDGDASEARISEQFKARAGDYHARYAASRHFEKMFRKALDQTGLAVDADPLIFDMGSGSGVNSIVPCFNLFRARGRWRPISPATFWRCWPTTPPRPASPSVWSAW